MSMQFVIPSIITSAVFWGYIFPHIKWNDIGDLHKLFLIGSLCIMTGVVFYVLMYLPQGCIWLLKQIINKFKNEWIKALNKAKKIGKPNNENNIEILQYYDINFNQAIELIINSSYRLQKKQDAVKSGEIKEEKGKVIPSHNSVAYLSEILGARQYILTTEEN